METHIFLLAGSVGYPVGIVKEVFDWQKNPGTVEIFINPFS